jgi:hypothetical protein
MLYNTKQFIVFWIIIYGILSDGLKLGNTETSPGGADAGVMCDLPEEGCLYDWSSSYNATYCCWSFQDIKQSLCPELNAVCENTEISVIAVDVGFLEDDSTIWLSAMGVTVGVLSVCYYGYLWFKTRRSSYGTLSFVQEFREALYSCWIKMIVYLSIAAGLTFGIGGIVYVFTWSIEAQLSPILWIFTLLQACMSMSSLLKVETKRIKNLRTDAYYPIDLVDSLAFDEESK